MAISLLSPAAAGEYALAGCGQTPRRGRTIWPNRGRPERAWGESMTTTRTEKWTIEKIMALNRERVIELWKECPAVDMAELDGEYTGLVPNAGNEAAAERTAAVMFDENSVRGYWLGKAYKPLSATKGDGYNHWRKAGGNVVRNLRFATEMGTSLIDGKPALMMYYGAYNSESTLIDEIRKLEDGIYLGMGAMEAEGGGRTPPGHFVLTGPIGSWLGADETRA